MKIELLVKILNLILFLALSSCGNSSFELGGTNPSQNNTGLSQNLLYGDEVTTAQGWKIKANFPVFMENKSLNSWTIKGE